MPLFNDANPDATSVPFDEASGGPHVDFLEAFNNAYDTASKASAAYGIEHAFSDLEDQQFRALRDIGVESLPRIGRSGSLDVAKYYEDGGTPLQAEQLSQYDTRVAELNKQYPDLGLKNSRDLWETVKANAQQAEAKLARNRNTGTGSVGEFLGTAGGSIDPRTDPLNFAVAPIGGIGKGAMQRIVLQGGLQGAAESINQFTGVQEERRLLGLSHGFTDALSRVGGAVVGGAGFQGAGELLALAGKRWFSPEVDGSKPPPPPNVKPPPDLSSPVDAKGRPLTPAEIKLNQHVSDFIQSKYGLYDDAVAREMSPYGETRSGAARTMLDLDYMKNKLEDWGGDSPVAVKPPSETSIPVIPDNVTRPEVRAADIGSIDELARRVDPRTFTQFDGLQTHKNVLQATLQKLQPDATKLQAMNEQLDAISSKIDNITHNMYSVGKKKRETMRPQLEALQAEKEKLLASSVGGQSPEYQQALKRYMQIDGQMRDMAPLVARAYTQARGEWSIKQSMRDRITHMIKSGRNTLPELPSGPKLEGSFEDANKTYQQTLVEKAPILEQSPKVEAQMRPDATPADYAKAIIADNMKVSDEMTDKFRESIGQVLADEKNKKITIAGTELSLDLDKDKITLPLEDGSGERTVTVRQLLEEMQASEEDLKATQTCSI